MRLPRWLQIQMSVRGLGLLVALAALGMVGWRVYREGVGTHWLMLKLRFGGSETRRAAAAELYKSGGGTILNDLFYSSASVPAPPELERRRKKAEMLIPALLCAAGDREPATRSQALRSAHVLAVFFATMPTRDEVQRAAFAALADPSDRVRAVAVDLMDTSDGRPMAPVLAALRAALDDPSVEVREASAWDLGMLALTRKEAQRDVAPILETVLAGRDEPRVRIKAAWSLGFLGNDVRRDPRTGPDVVPALTEALRRDPVAAVRREVADALGMGSVYPGSMPETDWASKKDAIVPALRAALADEDVRVREEAARSLFVVGLREPALFRLIKEGARDADPQRRTSFERAVTVWEQEEPCAQSIAPGLGSGLNPGQGGPQPAPGSAPDLRPPDRPGEPARGAGDEDDGPVDDREHLDVPGLARGRCALGRSPSPSPP